MELIRINNRKLKLMLTPTDMSHFELTADTIGEDVGKTHHAFRLLLSELKTKIGFDADDRHISVQYFPSREGGCEMFISNLQESNEKENKDQTDPPQRTHALQVRPSKKENQYFWRDFVYCFDTLDDLLSVCKRLYSIGYIYESSAYRDEKNRYYLFLSMRAVSPFSIPDEIGFVIEYGSIENVSAIKIYILEHGSPICQQDAIAKLSQLS